jgi:DNA-binding transcriptional LysR family regulator
MLDRITCIKSFVRTVETGSFSAVARELNTTQPTISKQIAALEEYLDVQLLIRSTRKVALTDEGMQFYRHSQLVLAALAEAEASVGSRQIPSGVLRVNCSVSFGLMQVMPCLKRFLDRYPDLKVDLTMSDYYVDLVEEGIDVAIRIGNFHAPNLISLPIGTSRLVTVAAVEYLAKFGEPRVPEDLLDRNCIVYTRQSTVNEWQFQGTSVTVRGNLQVNNSAALREAVLAGIGIGTSPIWAFCDELQRETVKIILEDYEPAPLPIQAVYRRGQLQPAKVKCWIDFLRDRFAGEFMLPTDH